VHKEGNLHNEGYLLNNFLLSHQQHLARLLKIAHTDAVKIDADAGKCSLQVSYDVPRLITHQIGDRTWQEIATDELTSDIPEGAPQVKSQSWLVEIPGSSDVTPTLTYDMTVINDVDLLPQPDSDTGLDDLSSITRNQRIYQTDAFYPAEILKISDPAIVRHHRLVDVSLTPYQYNPVTRELRVYTHVNVNLEFTGENPINPVTGIFPFESTFAHNLMSFTFGGAVFGVVAGGLMAVVGPVLPFRRTVPKAVLVCASFLKAFVP